jgi:excisionase family DNA binding protein
MCKASRTPPAREASPDRSKVLLMTSAGGPTGDGRLRAGPLVLQPYGKILRVNQRESRFLKLDDVAAELAISRSQTYALVRSGELSAIKIGGRGQWRVERSALEEYIARRYEQTRAFVASHPPDEDWDAGAEA